MDKEKERELVERAKAGDNVAFGQLVEEYGKMAFQVALGFLKDRDEAEDQVMEAFLKAWVSLDTFKGKSSFYTWLYRIVVNLCLNELGHKRPALNSSLEGAEDLIAGLVEDKTSGPENIVIAKELATAILRAVNELPRRLKDVLVLKEKGFSYKQIAAYLRIPLGTVNRQVSELNQQLRAALQPYR